VGSKSSSMRRDSPRRFVGSATLFTTSLFLSSFFSTQTMKRRQKLTTFFPSPVRPPPRPHVRPASLSPLRNRFYPSDHPARSLALRRALARHPCPTSILAPRRLPFTETLPHPHYLRRCLLRPLRCIDPDLDEPSRGSNWMHANRGQVDDGPMPLLPTPAVLAPLRRHRPQPSLLPPFGLRHPRMMSPPPLQLQLTRRESPPDVVSGSTPPLNRRHLRICVNAVLARRRTSHLRIDAAARSPPPPHNRVSRSTPPPDRESTTWCQTCQ
jgi:hypothetical protein